MALTDGHNAVFRTAPKARLLFCRAFVGAGENLQKGTIIIITVWLKKSL